MTPQELKNSILQLAIQGKLVEQRADEGTGAELLEKILAAKNAEGAKKAGVKSHAKSAKSAKIGPCVSREEIPDDEKPFDIPESWEWVRLGDISSVITKGTTPRGGNVSYSDKGVGFLRAENIAGLDALDKSNLKYIDEETHFGILRRSILVENDILITIAGTLGRTAIVRNNDLPLNANQAVSMIRLVDAKTVNLKYIIIALNSPVVQRLLTKQKKVTAIPNLTLGIIGDCMFPLPPLAEQKRIVAKIEELLPLVDRYEKAWSRLEDFNKRFPVDMQKSLLQMAIQGELVEQRPEEGTAAELLEKILAVKNAKDAKKNLPRRRSDAEATKESRLTSNVSRPVEDAPFDIPESWEWVRLESIINSVPTKQYQILESEVCSSGRFAVISQSKEYSIGFTDKSDKVYRHANPVIVFGDHTAEVKYVEFDFVVGADGVKVFEPKDSLITAKLLFYILQHYSCDLSKVGGYSRHYKFLKNKLIPLPPLAEQKRIVAKLEELLPLCERLKSASNNVANS